MKGVIKVRNIFSVIENGEVEYLKNLLRFRPKGYYFMPAYRSGLWDGYVSFLRKNNVGKYFFPSGFIFAKPEWFEGYVIIDERNKPLVSLKDYQLEGIQLRDYQEEAIKKALQEERGILNLATNAGKTEVAIAVSKSLSNLRVLFITHRLHLLFQTKKRFEDRLKEEVGYIGKGEIYKPESRIVVAMVQSLYEDVRKFENYFKKFQVVFWDEVHHLSSDSWYIIGKKIPAYYRFGLTATVPDVADIRYWKLVALTGKVFYVLKQKLLVESGISAKPYIYMIVVNERKVGDYQEVYKELVEESNYRNGIIKEVCDIFKDLRKVILVRTIRHGRKLLEQVEGVLLTGQENIKERLTFLEKFRKGEIKTLIVTTWFEEGTDIPEVEVFINAAGGLSDNLLVQRMGRAVRRKEKENRVFIIDFYDMGERYLRKHSMNRKKVYEKEGFEVKLLSLVNQLLEVKQ